MMETMSLKDRMDSLGGTVAEIQVNGITYYSVGFRYTGDGEVDVYDINGEKVANAVFHSDTEQVTLTVNGEESASSNVYFEHEGKMEYDLAEDLGTYLAALL